MGKRNKKRQLRSALGSHRLLLILVVAVTVLDIAVSAWAVTDVRREMTQSTLNMVQMRIDQMYDKFSAINQSLKRILVEAYQETELVGALDADPLIRIQNRQKLLTRCTYLSAEAGSEFLLFYYFEQTDDFLVARHSAMVPMEQRDALQQAISHNIQLRAANDSVAGRWDVLEVDGVYYALKAYNYYGIWIGGCVPAEALTAPLAATYPDQDAVPLLLTADGRIAAGAGALEAQGISPEEALSGNTLFWHGGQRWMAVESQNPYLSFDVRLLLPSYGRFERVMLLQTAALVAVGLVLCLVVLSMAYTQRRILQPLRAFTDGLKNYDPDDPLLPKMSGELAELDEASETFSNLTKEIQRLRIDAYENQLAQQKLQMDYMQLQIKPHFFLNSLNLIHTMAQNGQSADIERLSEVTAHYLRYLFQSDSDWMPLAGELDHIRNYLSIMAIRYPGAFSYDIYTEDGVQDERVPPLILQTFVENCIKYGMVPGKKLDISLSVLYEEQEVNGAAAPYLVIFLTDNGRGFPPGHLALWQRGQSLPREDGRHIGIANAAARLQYAYGGAARMSLYNSPLGGAVVELHLPAGQPGKEAPKA